MATPPASDDPGDTGPWAPLRQPTFRALWLAILWGNVGTWIHDVAAAWRMAETTGSPLMVAAVQAATTLPVVLFALVAGTLADSIDRRRYLILAQWWMLMVATVLALLAQADLLGPWTLLALTFALGTGAAMAMPAQAAIMPELVSRPQLPSAIALNSAGMNVARSIGPALGGVVVAQTGVATAFAINALSFLGVAIVLWRWKRTSVPSLLPPEAFIGGLRSGVRFALQASAFQSVLWKAIAFFVFASATPALLPSLVRSRLDGGAGVFGLLLGCIGLGAICGTLILPGLRRRFDRDLLVFAATLLCAAATLSVANSRSVLVLGVVLFGFGAGWIGVLSSLQVAAQLSVAAWVRARALSLYIVVFALGMATGSLVWGALAQRLGIGQALGLAACGAVLAAWWSRRFLIGQAESLDFTPSAHWPDPLPVDPVAHDRGPVLVTVEYRIGREDQPRFLELMSDLRRSRRRDGALYWHLAEDTEQPGVWLEVFVLESWLHHLRQHARTTRDDERLQQQVRELNRNPAPPRVRHFIGDRNSAGPMSHRHDETAPT